MFVPYLHLLVVMLNLETGTAIHYVKSEH